MDFLTDTQLLGQQVTTWLAGAGGVSGVLAWARRQFRRIDARLIDVRETRRLCEDMSEQVRQLTADCSTTDGGEDALDEFAAQHGLGNAAVDELRGIISGLP